MQIQIKATHEDRGEYGFRNSVKRNLPSNDPDAEKVISEFCKLMTVYGYAADEITGALQSLAELD